MTDSTTETETETETEAQAETPQSEAHNAVFERLREAGEIGKKEWEEVLNKVGKLLQLPPEERRDELKTNVQDAFTRAQGRGATLLLQLLSQVRKGVVSLEDSLRESRVDDTVAA
jgi:hypothetical protein